MTRLPALALCASNATGVRPHSCALRTASGTFAVHSTIGQRGDLAHLAAELCRTHGVAAADLRELRLDLGPGSYTGLRVAVTLARCLATFDAIPVLTTDTLTLLAHASGPQPTDRRLRPVLDARAGHVHDGHLRWHPTGLRHDQPPRAIPTATWLASLAPNDLVLAPANLPADMLNAIRTRCPNLITPQDPDATTLFAPNLPLTPTPPHHLTPHYLLPSYAELPRP